MALEVGSRLGHYEVTALIGEGGMGQVYQATDTKLKRQVALKILPEAFAADPERLARFQREAQVLASLHHPDNAAIYGLEEQDGVKVQVAVSASALFGRPPRRPSRGRRSGCWSSHSCPRGRSTPPARTGCRPGPTGTSPSRAVSRPSGRRE